MSNSLTFDSFVRLYF